MRSDIGSQWLTRIDINRLLDKLSSSLSQHETLFERLFPGKSVHVLLAQPREELINLALSLPTATAGSPKISSISPKNTEGSNRSDGAESLEALEQAPDQDPDQDETQRQLDTNVQRVSDDVNGLSLSVDKQSSYVGASSITAALKVIFKIAPGTRHVLTQLAPAEMTLPTCANTPSHDSPDVNPRYLPPAEIGHALIESYFARIHALMPMVEEQQFWHTWLYGERRDAPWLALLNTVFTLGSLALGDASDDQHTVFFNRARQHIDLETLGSGNLLVVQALGLLSGYYLHYVNRPNLANNLMGATLRMATVLGLHREFTQPTDVATARHLIDHRLDSTPSETRRRTWWTLFCLDTWAGTTTGRPSLGRLGPGVTIQLPPTSVNKMNDSQYLASLKALPLVYNITFCKLSTRIQDTLSTTHLLRHEDLLDLNAELVAWHDDLPDVLVPQVISNPSPDRQRISTTSKCPNITPGITTPEIRDPFDFAQPPNQSLDSETCPDFLKTARAVMHWRYQNLRIVLHRPSILAAALRRIPFASLSAEEKVAVGRCRVAAAQAIADINSMCGEDLISGWNAVWFMYQAAMVPLVSLFSHLSISATLDPNRIQNRKDSPLSGTTSPDVAEADENADRWRSQIETAISFFDCMTRWSVAAKKSRDVVARLYAASKQLSHYSALQQQMHSHQLAQQRPQSPHQALNLESFASQIDSSPSPEAARQHAHLHPPALQQPQPRRTDPGPYTDTDTDTNIPIPDPFASHSIWDHDYSPSNDDAAMNRFWQEMQWDSVPVFDNNGRGTYTTDSQDNAGMGFWVGGFRA